MLLKDPVMPVLVLAVLVLVSGMGHSSGTRLVLQDLHAASIFRTKLGMTAAACG